MRHARRTITEYRATCVDCYEEFTVPPGASVHVIGTGHSVTEARRYVVVPVDNTSDDEGVDTPADDG